MTDCVDEGVPATLGDCVSVGLTVEDGVNDAESVASWLPVTDWLREAACEFVPDAVLGCVWLVLAPWLPVGDVVGVAP